MRNKSNVLKWSLSAALFVLFLILDTSFFPALPAPFRFISIILDTVLFLTIVVNVQAAVWWAIAGGTIFDFLGLAPLGTHLVPLVLTVAGINALFVRSFTNRSLYTLLLLGSLGYLLYALGVVGMIILYNSVSKFSFPAFTIYGGAATFLKQAGGNLLIIAIAFLIARRVNRRMRSVFLTR